MACVLWKNYMFKKRSGTITKNGAKMEPWALLGLTFAILGRLGRGRFLMRFWSGKKSATNLTNRTLKHQKGGRTVFLGRPGGMRGGTGEGL